MDNFANAFKNVIKIAGVIAVFYFGAPFLAALAAVYVGLKAVDAVKGLTDGRRESLMNPSAEVDPEQMKRNVAVHRSNANREFFDFRNGQWNVRSFPLDMYPTMGVRDSNKCLFTCCGMENVVEGSVKRDIFGRQKAVFTMEIRDEKKAQDVADAIARSGLVGTQVLRKNDSSFVLRSDNAVDISTLVKQFYPPRSFEVAREVETRQQFVVSGCASYEDALREFKENRSHYSPVNTVVSYQNIIDGHREPRLVSNADYMPGTLPVGSYVIDETVVDYYSKNVTVNGGVDMTDEAMRSEAAAAARFGVEDKVEDRCSFEPKYTNGLEGREPARTITLDGRQVEVMQKGSPGLGSTGAALYVAFSSQEELLDALTGKTSLLGRMVLVDTSEPDIDKNEYLLKIPADERLISSLSLPGDDAVDLAEKLEGLGVSREDIERTLICNEISKYGYLSARLNDDIDISKALVGNVSAQQFVERMRDLPEKSMAEKIDSAAKAKLWCDEAAMIKSVDMQLDFRKRELVITSTIVKDHNSHTKIESCPLTDEQLKRLSNWDAVSKTELKDLLMRLHPDFFTVYRNADGTSRYADPIRDFIAGRKPQLREDVKKEKKQQKQVKAETKGQEQKKEGVKKPSRSPKVGY